MEFIWISHVLWLTRMSVCENSFLQFHFCAVHCSADCPGENFFLNGHCVYARLYGPRGCVISCEDVLFLHCAFQMERSSSILGRGSNFSTYVPSSGRLEHIYTHPAAFVWAFIENALDAPPSRNLRFIQRTHWRASEQRIQAEGEQ